MSVCALASASLRKVTVLRAELQNSNRNNTELKTKDILSSLNLFMYLYEWYLREHCVKLLINMFINDIDSVL